MLLRRDWPSPWLAHSLTFEQLGEKYCVGASTCHKIIHDTIAVLLERLVSSSIKIPGGRKLDCTMAGFESIAGLPMCAGAIDGTFIHMQKPSVWGDTYWCYRNFIAIILLGVCDHRCCFTFVDVGRAGCVGDAYTYNESSLKRRIEAGQWLADIDRDIGGTFVKPYIIGDSAFALGSQLLKCYENPVHRHQKKFNRALISSRQKIENAFGFLKGRWRILTQNFIRDPAFMRDVALVCTALHNICQRANCRYDAHWNVRQVDYVRVGPALPVVQPEDTPSGNEVRFAVATSL